ncbi:DHA2 family efflux MFS transporter permease subunit [Piscinibacter koreensis]|uniref:DHA2 family efflux MFS transporter permease subunit n=1 Tax=Piscinibacter koreensis TaxID=2742824 RepID=A0A7Y6NPS8_9BURK|nr:DHA2 family efflux MFS transporter permease subunit [Schlegelella koreensis]NUZ07074.1 DHA2 family efflux MFS transporter permease subunit [Schlegelella koreensis]
MSSTAVAAGDPREGSGPAAAAPAAPPRHVEYPPLHGSQLVLGTIALSLATFMNVLDSSIANVSIPAIAGDMGVSPAQGTWVITSFGVANAISVPLTGWLTQRFGPVRLFVASILLFVLASWLCGLAPNIGLLIAFRVLQGLVAGPMIPLSQTLLLSSYPRAKAGSAMAMWAITVLVAPVMGPLLGGWITDNMSWPWIFYINIPVGMIAAAITWSIYRERDPGPKKLPLDFVGLGLLVLWVGALQIMIDKGKELDWFGSTQIVVLAVVAVVGFLFFLAWELTEKNPIVDLRLFGRRNFMAGTLALSVAYGLFFGNVVLLPLWLQQYMGYTATWAGLAMAPVGLLAIVLSPWVGKNVSKIDPRRLATVAFLGFALVLWMRSRFNVQADFRTVLIPTLMQGAAMAFFFIPLQAVIFSGLGPEKMPAAAGLSNFVRITAGAMGTSLFTTAWEDRAVLHHAQLAESVNRGNAAAMATLDQLRAGGMSTDQALGTINRLVDQQAFTMAATDLFMLSAGLFVVLLGLVWMTKPTLGGGGDVGGAH